MDCYGLYLGVLSVVLGVLLMIDPKFLRQCWPFMSLTELNSPIDDVDRTVSKLIGVCCILAGSACIVWTLAA